QIIGMPGEMRCNKHGIWVRPDHVKQFVDDRLPGSRVISLPFAAGTELQFEPPFIQTVQGLPERSGIGCMDEHRNAQLTAKVPHRSQFWMRQRDTVPFAVLMKHTLALVDLQSA